MAAAIKLCDQLLLVRNMGFAESEVLFYFSETVQEHISIHVQTNAPCGRGIKINQSVTPDAKGAKPARRLHREK
jgi:hypothetical protein